MHENLKFNLQPKALGEWQPIVASQTYGTFYGIFIQFMDIKEENGISYYSCRYKLQNFRGAVSMGFKKIPQINKIHMPNEEDPVDYEFLIEVAPFNHYWDTDIKIHEIAADICTPGLIFDANVIVFDPPKFLYDEKNPDGALYLHPHEYQRDGEDYLKISYNKHGEEISDSGSNNGEGFGKFPGICDMTRSITR